MKNEPKKIIKSYIKDVSKNLNCKYSVKRLFLADFKNRILDYLENKENIAVEELYSVFGTPNEISRGFDSVELDKYEKQAKNLKWIIVLLIVLIAILSYAIFIIVAGYGTDVTVTTDSYISLL
ncbi:hypothetical protein BN85403390 [Alteracholeplasma palmae J233]|uniref:Uncharacterized protein n=1 Tax=Alteracholeplasma palmae (strain ATCC 49389 / J233) TaxID=1318466 RepID=U4KR75_ALTPJ|nr:DUF6120 family protein [Alteracholeplasma palmae]CCV63916.1 hypothetical protein BN85403390 [Alteracholeplasma palmae J233]